MKHIRWIASFWKPHRKWLYALFFLTLLSSAVTIGYPLVFKYLIDAINKALANNAPEVSSSVTWRLVGVIAAIGLARSLANLYPGTRAMINAKLEMDIRQHYFSAIVGKGYRFFQKFRTGDLVTRLTDDIGGFPKIAWFSCSGIFRAVESGSKFLFCMGFMFYMNWLLAVLTLPPLAVMLYLFYRVRTILGQRAADRQRIISKTNDALEAAFSGVRIVKAFTAENGQAAEFRKILKERIGIELLLMTLWMGMHNLYWAIEFVGQIVVVVAGGLMVINGTLTIGEFYAFYVYLSLLLGPLMDIPNLFVTSRQAFASIDREIEIEETPGGTERAFDGKEEVPALNSLEIRGASFKYNENLPCSLDGIDISISRGERVAVVGQVGSGKSTLLKMAAGILPITAGEVLVNGMPIEKLDIAKYRNRVGYIPQEATLFSETVADNVRFGRAVTESDVERSLEVAQVLDEMKSLPNGLAQVLGQRGLTISGGQKQRLAIARALAGSPDLLLMDDCTASLDAENERAFWQMFRETNPDAACLIVTHRLATARQADTIYVLADGKIVGKGTHQELLENCEEYRSFLTREELVAALKPAVV
ncbi:MAG: ABC transporter ATP-binding protein [bacterium]|jgi:ATP-binding cassette subfamily B protein